MELGKKARKTLEHINLMSNGGGMYPGARCDDVSHKVGSRLYREGLVRTFIPSNIIHKERWVITDKGRDALSSN